MSTRIGRPPKTERYRVDPETGCHLWLLGYMEGGYGCEWDGERQRMVGAHIMAWERKNGPVPPGRELHHTCLTRLCVNPDHLRALTRAEHSAVHVALRRGVAA